MKKEKEAGIIPPTEQEMMLALKWQCLNNQKTKGNLGKPADRTRY